MMKNQSFSAEQGRLSWMDVQAKRHTTWLAFSNYATVRGSTTGAFVLSAEITKTKSVKRYLTEKANQQIVGMQFGSNLSLGNMQGVASMSTQLPGFAVDPMNLGLGSQIASMAQPGLYGDALQASLKESRNLSRMQAFGIDPGTKMDPMAYAKQLSGMQG